jgi:hypothetical protein
MAVLTLPKSRRLWTPSDASATAWWDTTLPGGFLQGLGPTGACEGARLLRDWSGNGHHALQATAANQGTLSLLAPGALPTSMGGTGFLCDNVNDGWATSDNLGASVDHTMVCGVNVLHVPAAITPASAFMNSTIVGGKYHGLGTFNTALGIVDSGGQHASTLNVLTGSHAYTAIVDGATSKAWLYVDATKAAAEVTAEAVAYSLGMQLATTYVYTSPDAVCFRWAVWDRKLTATEQLSAAAWAVRNNG